MATLFNNTEITNAFFNGTELDKIYFNGVLVFEKGGKYKRRIMVGDDLKGKIIYFDGLTKSEVDFICSILRAEFATWLFGTADTNSLLVAIEGWDPASYYSISSSYDDIQGDIFFYDLDNDSLITCLDNFKINNDKNYIITDIDYQYASFAGGGKVEDNGFLYRKFYIEDEYIRPIQEGDIILSTTKIYLTFPDNFYESNSVQMPPILTANSSDNNINAWLWYTSATITGGGVPISIILSVSGMSGYNGEDWYQLDSNNSNIETNISYTTLPLTQPIIVDSIDTSQSAKNIVQNILVDTRTLGTSGYKRRIQVGDNLKNRNIYSDFSENFSNELINYYSGSSNSNIFISPVNSDTTIINKFHDIYGRTPAGDTVRVEFSDEHVFYYLHTDGTVEINNNFSMSSNINYEVGEVIEDSPTYRHIYIEDNKIRPVQVGDKIIEGTKFYFNFPDDLYINLTNYKVDWIIKIENENGDIIGIAASTDEENRTIAARRKKHNVTGVYIGTVFYSHYTPFGTTDKELEINSSHDIAKNILVDRQDSTLYLSGTVSEINTTYADVYKYILVDITTLG